MGVDFELKEGREGSGVEITSRWMSFNRILASMMLRGESGEMTVREVEKAKEPIERARRTMRKKFPFVRLLLQGEGQGEEDVVA